MTVISAPATDSLLRFALRLDATLTGLLGLAVAAAAGPLSTMTGFTAGQEYLAGAALVLYGVVVFRLAGVRSVRRAGVGVVVANLVCTVGAVALVASAALPLTTLGVTALIGSAVYTTAFAVLQYVGVRRMA